MQNTTKLSTPQCSAEYNQTTLTGKYTHGQLTVSGRILRPSLVVVATTSESFSATGGSAMKSDIIILILMLYVIVNI